MKAFLFLRTCITAVANTGIHIESAKARIQWSLGKGNYHEHWAYEAEMRSQQRDVEIWEDRWAEAGVGLVGWIAFRSLGRRLPVEILGIVGKELRRGDMELPPLR